MRGKLKFFAGVAIGIGIGAATDNLGIGIGIGIAFGAALSQTKNEQKSHLLRFKLRRVAPHSWGFLFIAAHTLE